MKKKPLISVVITYYKKKAFIKRTLQSIFNQTYKNYEIIFVYDQEEKKDLEFIKKLLSRFKRKKLLSIKKITVFLNQETLQSRILKVNI